MTFAVEGLQSWHQWPVVVVVVFVPVVVAVALVVA